MESPVLMPFEAYELFKEMETDFYQTAGVMTFAPVGIKLLNESINWNVSDENPDPKLFIGTGHPNDPSTEVNAAWPKSVISGAVEDGGWLTTWLSHAWLALVFSKWEDYYRGEFATLHRVKRDLVQSGVMGDIRLLRNDVIHNRAIASEERTGRCRVIAKFRPGDQIVLSPSDIKFLRDRLSVEIPTHDIVYSTNQLPLR